MKAVHWSPVLFFAAVQHDPPDSAPRNFAHGIETAYVNDSWREFTPKKTSL